MVGSEKSKLKEIWFGTQNIPSLLPGVILAAVLMLLSKFLTDFIGNMLTVENPISMILVALIFGLLIKTLFKLPQFFEPGISFGLKKLLRFGIILLGIRLSIFAILKIGILSAGMVAVCIVSALAITMFLAKKIGVSEKLGTLIAAGTSICGASAIIATGPTIDAEEEEIAYAVATITIFGLVATIAYPYLVQLVLHLTPEKAGFFIGTSVHETAQVTATAFIYDQLWNYKLSNNLTGGDIAITVKLIRNTFMIFVIPFLGFWFARKKTESGVESKQKIRIIKYIPVFVIGYLVMAIFRSAGDYIFENNEVWVSSWKFIKTTAGYVIATSLACIGLSIDIKKLIKLRLKPFVCGLIASFSVGAVSYILITLFGSFLKF